MIPLRSHSQEQEIYKIREMLNSEELKLRTIERYVLLEYLKSLEK